MKKRGITVTKIEGRRLPWRVRFWDGQRRRMTHFLTKEEAEGLAERLRRELDQREFGLSFHERQLLLELRTLGADRGRKLVEVLGEAVTAERERERLWRVTRREAAEAHVTHLQQRNLRARSIAAVDALLRKLVGEKGDAPMASLTRGEVLRFITSYKAEATRKSVRGWLTGWLRWCAAPERAWCSAEVFADLEWQAVLQDAEQPQILTAEEVGRLLHTAQRLQRAVVPSLALMVFAGVRPGEICDRGKERLCWEAVDLRRRVIRIPAAISKTRRGREIGGLAANLWAWLELSPEAEQLPVPREGGPPQAQSIVPRGMSHDQWQGWRERIAAAAGVALSHDVLRHTFASFAYHAYGYERTVEMLGHGTSKMLWKHYKAALGTEVAGEYTTIAPVKSG